MGECVGEGWVRGRAQRGPAGAGGGRAGGRRAGGRRGANIGAGRGRAGRVQRELLMGRRVRGVPRVCGGGCAGGGSARREDLREELLDQVGRAHAGGEVAHVELALLASGHLHPRHRRHGAQPRRVAHARRLRCQHRRHDVLLLHARQAHLHADQPRLRDALHHRRAVLAHVVPPLPLPLPRRAAAAAAAVAAARRAVAAARRAVAARPTPPWWAAPSRWRAAPTVIVASWAAAAPPGAVPTVIIVPWGAAPVIIGPWGAPPAVAVSRVPGSVGRIAEQAGIGDLILRGLARVPVLVVPVLVVPLPLAVVALHARRAFCLRGLLQGPP